MQFSLPLIKIEYWFFLYRFLSYMSIYSISICMSSCQSGYKRQKYKNNVTFITQALLNFFLSSIFWNFFLLKCDVIFISRHKCSINNNKFVLINQYSIKCVYKTIVKSVQNYDNNFFQQKINHEGQKAFLLSLANLSLSLSLSLSLLLSLSFSPSFQENRQ